MPPKVAKIEVTDEEIERTKRLMEDIEIKKLKREYMLMRDRESVDSMVEKQTKVIKALSVEQHNLLNNLSVMQTQRRLKLDSKQSKHIFDLFGQGDSKDLEISKEKKVISELEAQIRKETLKRKGVESGSKAVVSEYLQKEENQHADRSLDAWKSRLHAEQVQLGQATQENAELRKQVEFLLKNKKRFNELFEEMIFKLNKGKQMLKGIAERSTAIVKGRDEVARKVQALKEKDAVDLRKRQDEMQDLEMRLNEEQLLVKFKNKVMKSRVLLSQGLRATKKATLMRSGQEERLRYLQLTWETINQDLDDQNVCDVINRRETENFSLFNYNNELRCQLEVLTEETVKLMTKVEEEQDRGLRLEEEHEAQKQMMEQRLTEIEMMSNDLKEQLDASNRLFDRLLTKIQSLFQLTECDTWSLEQLLGENGEVTIFNYRLYLDLIESKLLEFLNLLPIVAPELIPFITNKTSTASGLPVHKSLRPTSTLTVGGVSVLDKLVVTRECPDCSEKRRPNPSW